MIECSQQDHVETAKDITEYVNSSIGSTYSVNFVWNLIKNYMKLSNKSVKSRPNWVNIDRINTIRSLFKKSWRNSLIIKLSW